MSVSEDEIEKLLQSLEKVVGKVKDSVEVCVRAGYILREFERALAHTLCERLGDEGVRALGELSVETEKVRLTVTGYMGRLTVTFSATPGMKEDAERLAARLGLYFRRTSYPTVRGIREDDFQNYDSPVIAPLILKHLAEGGAERLAEVLKNKAAEIEGENALLGAAIRTVEKAISPLVLASKL
ncbi:MAG: hypothetical protein DRP11_00990 [Candidatus Aenigmatarchaeota archaeon]|nr:MAG: hypothetical protein DRP11_00990 [Candidatus Aenigmarchaeota archaeon]